MTHDIKVIFDVLCASYVYNIWNKFFHLYYVLEILFKEGCGGFSHNCGLSYKIRSVSDKKFEFDNKIYDIWLYSINLFRDLISAMINIAMMNQNLCTTTILIVYSPFMTFHFECDNAVHSGAISMTMYLREIIFTETPT